MVKKSKHSPKSILSELQAKGKKYKGKEFWQIHPTNGKPIIDPALLREFLIANGFAKLNFFSGFIYVKKTYNIVEHLTSQDVFNYCLGYVNVQNKKNLTSEFIVQGERHIISKIALLGSLPEIEIQQYKDTIETSHYFFENTVVRISEKGIKVLTYNKFQKLNKFIFKSQIIKRNFDKEASNKPQIKKFFKLITNSKEHYLNVLTAIGYLLHKYKNPSVAKAVVISDMLSQATNNPHGRSGKGLVVKAISELLNVVEYNGKNLDLRRDKFVYQSIEPDTDLFVIQDVSRGFDFEDLFSSITDRMNIEKKHTKKVIIDFSNSPKIAITTNYTIPNSSDSYKDRKQLIILNNYFNAHNKPEHEFKNLFFSQWNESEYQAFDTFMMKCLQLYLKHGLTHYDDPDLRRQNLIANTSKEFVELMENEYNSKKEYYNVKDLANKLDIPSQEQSVRSRVASQWLQLYADFKNLKYDSRTSGGITKFRLSKEK